MPPKLSERKRMLRRLHALWFVLWAEVVINLAFPNAWFNSRCYPPPGHTSGDLPFFFFT